MKLEAREIVEVLGIDYNRASFLTVIENVGDYQVEMLKRQRNSIEDTIPVKVHMKRDRSTNTVVFGIEFPEEILNLGEKESKVFRKAIGKSLREMFNGMPINWYPVLRKA